MSSSTVTCARVTATLYQEVDCCSSGDVNEITLTVEDGGGGPYFVISTERWAMDGVEEFEDLVATVVGAIIKAREKS